FSELQDKIQSYITNLRTSTAELDYNNIDNLLIKYNYVTGTKEIQRNKPLVKALLQRAVFDKLIELLKDFGSDTYQYKSRDLDMIYMNWQTNYMIIHLNLIHMNGEAIGYNDNNDNKEHGFIKFNKQLLDQHISQYRKIIDQRKQTELATLSGEIIRDFVKIFHFTLLEDLDDLEICWILNGSAIDSEFMEGQWDYNNIDNYVIEICRFPLIRSSKKIYSLAKVFADKLDNSNTIIKSNTSLEVIKWNANAKDKLGTKTLLVSETRFGGGGWTTETATDDEFDEFYGEPKSETLVNAESKELSKTCYELVEETTTKKGKVITGNSTAKSIQFSQDLSELQDKIQSYITNLRTTIAELDYNNIDNLLIKYNYVTGAKEIQRNKPLVKALLQRAVFDKLIELLKDFGSDTYQYKPQNLRGLEYDLYELANKLYDYSFESDPYEWRSNQYRKIIDQRKQTELATLSGEIIRDFVKIFHFTLLEDLDDLEICWILNGSAIDSEFMEGQWDYNNIDNYVIEICRFPLIRSSKKIYSLAKVFADKLDNSNTIIKSNTSLEVIKWNANAKDKLGTKTLLVSETRFGGGGWTTETATDDEFDEFYGEPKSETLVNAESKELSKTCYELVEETTTKKGKVITATSAIGSVFSTFFGRHDTKSIETTQNIISKQTNEGSFHISDTLSEILEISSDTKSQSFKSTIQTYAVSKCLKKTTTHHTWWSTAITISYLKLHAFSHETTWKIQYEKARKYLSEQIKDAELEEELLKTCCNLVEEKTTKKVVYTETKEEIVERKK
ncbi:11416_t:CDS:2, partial [Entrophospora sp. SA101]